MQGMFKNFFEKIKNHIVPKEEKRRVLFRAQEIWWCSVEDAHTKTSQELPVLVFRKFENGTFWGLPLTPRNTESNQPFYVLVSFRGKSQAATLSRMRTIPASRLIRRLGKMSGRQFDALNARIFELLRETDPLRGPRVPSGKRLQYPVERGRASIRYPRPATSFFPSSYSFKMR